MCEKTKYEINQDRFANDLLEKRWQFIEENKIVYVNDRVIGIGYEEGKIFQITYINLTWLDRGAMSETVPMIEYYGKPVNKKGKIMYSRVDILLREFMTKNGVKYVQETGWKTKLGDLIKNE